MPIREQIICAGSRRRFVIVKGRRTVLRIPIRPDILFSYEKNSKEVFEKIRRLIEPVFSCGRAQDEEIENCKVMVACITRDYFKSKSCIKEMECANKSFLDSPSIYPKILPLLLEDMDCPPSGIRGKMKKILSLKRVRENVCGLHSVNPDEWEGQRVEYFVNKLRRIIPRVDLLVLYEDSDFTATVDEDDIQGRGKVGLYSYIKCRVEGISAGYNSFEEVRDVLGPLFPGEDIEAIVQKYGKADGKKVAEVLSPSDVVDEKVNVFCYMDGNEPPKEKLKRTDLQKIHTGSGGYLLIVSGRRTVLQISPDERWSSSSEVEEEDTTRHQPQGNVLAEEEDATRHQPQGNVQAEEEDAARHQPQGNVQAEKEDAARIQPQGNVQAEEE